jgi:hypothetical protein
VAAVSVERRSGVGRAGQAGRRRSFLGVIDVAAVGRLCAHRIPDPRKSVVQRCRSAAVVLLTEMKERGESQIGPTDGRFGESITEVGPGRSGPPPFRVSGPKSPCCGTLSAGFFLSLPAPAA